MPMGSKCRWNFSSHWHEKCSKSDSSVSERSNRILSDFDFLTGQTLHQTKNLLEYRPVKLQTLKKAQKCNWRICENNRLSSRHQNQSWMVSFYVLFNFRKIRSHLTYLLYTKGQLILERNLGVFKSSKKLTKFLKDFCL